jgi:hypothetical protein
MSRYTILLDMDETLLRAVTNENESYYIQDVDMIEPSYEVNAVTDRGNGYKIKVYLRPMVHEVLGYLSEHFNVVIFTAGT